MKSWFRKIMRFNLLSAGWAFNDRQGLDESAVAVNK
jgi:hypothetical protein